VEQTLVSSDSEETLLKVRVLSVPEGEGEADSLMVIAEQGREQRSVQLAVEREDKDDGAYEIPPIPSSPHR
jgi:hypothetical protein